jgi:hypothetical protein
VTQRLGQLSFLLILVGLALVGFLSAEGGTPTLAFKITDGAGSATLTGPAHMRGGLVNVKLTNTGKASHSAQLILVKGAMVKGSEHTVGAAVKLLTSHPKKIPVWLRFLGGVGPTPPGQSNVATINLTGGQYVVADLSNASSKLVTTTVTIEPGNPGPLPKTSASVTGATGPKGSTDHYQWKLSGLKAGTNRITFDSEGKKSIHQLVAVRLKGSPSLARLKKGLKSKSTPSFVDTSAPPTGTAALDGDNTHIEVASLRLAAGTYAFYCPLTDRKDGKPHFLEGMLTTLALR